MTGVLASFRYLLLDLIGADDTPRPQVPAGLPPALHDLVADAIARLVAYQGPGYAVLYLQRLRRFSRRRDVGDAMCAEIARLMLARMCYDDPIARAHRALCAAGADSAADTSVAVLLEDVVACLPAPLLTIPVVGVDWSQWCRASKPLRFRATRPWGRFGLRRLAGLRRWRLFSPRYARERAWVEHWLHMVDRGLTRQPAAVPEIVASATMIAGDGAGYRRGVADWCAIIDGLVRPAFDRKLALPDIAAAMGEARAASDSPGGVAAAVETIRKRAAPSA